MHPVRYLLGPVFDADCLAAVGGSSGAACLIIGLAALSDAWRQTLGLRSVGSIQIGRFGRHLGSEMGSSKTMVQATVSTSSKPYCLIDP